MNAIDFGIRPDIGTDQTAAIQAAINAAKGSLDFANGTYIHSGNIALKDNVALVSSGRGAILQNTANTPTFTATSVNHWLVGDGLKLMGTSLPFPSQVDSGQHGIVADGCEVFDVRGLTASGLSGDILLHKNAPSWWTQAKVTDVNGVNCYRGIHGGPGGEYLRVTNCGFNRCIMPLDTEAGNQIIHGLHCYNNYTTMRWTGGTNDGHSVVSDVIADHSWYPLICNDLDAGLSITNFQALCDLSSPIAAPVIKLTNSQGINIVGGQIAANIVIDGTQAGGMPNRNGVNQMACVFIRQPYVYTLAAPVVQNGGTTPSYKNNFTATGMWAYNN